MKQNLETAHSYQSEMIYNVFRKLLKFRHNLIDYS